MTKKTKTIFKIEEVENAAGNAWEDRIIAVFPDTARDNPGHVKTYASGGRHSEAPLTYIARLKNAEQPEYAALADELRRMGYSLDLT